MNTIFVLYLLNTLLFAIALVKQFLIIVRSPKGDEKIMRKTAVFICCLMIMSAMWLSYLMIPGAAWFFFLIAIIVIVWVYKDEKFKQ